jgi:tripartite-type tricarboxylate transporter receptor subunit TctC
VQFVAGTASQTIGMVKAGKLRPIAVMQKQRVASLPDVQSAPEAGFPELDYKTWFGLWGPARLPADVVAKLSEALKEVLAREDVRAQLDKGGVEPAYSSPQEFDAMFRADHAKWNRLLAGLIK